MVEEEENSIVEDPLARKSRVKTGPRRRLREQTRGFGRLGQRGRRAKTGGQCWGGLAEKSNQMRLD